MLVLSACSDDPPPEPPPPAPVSAAPAAPQPPTAAEIAQADALVEQAFAVSNAGDQPGARALLDHAISLNPTAPLYFVRKGITFEKEDDFEAAVAVYDWGLKKSPDDPGLWQQKGAALNSMGKELEAATAFKRYFEVTPPTADRWEKSVEIGWIFNRAGQYENAEASFQQAIDERGEAISPLGTYADYWNVRARTMPPRSLERVRFYGNAVHWQGKLFEEDDSFTNRVRLSELLFLKWNESGNGADRDAAVDILRQVMIDAPSQADSNFRKADQRLAAIQERQPL